MKQALLALLLSGCAFEPYWVKTYAPVEVKHVVTVDFPCGRSDLDGCANRRAHTIELRRGLSPTMRHCILHHEIRHFAGYEHDPRPGFVADCGDGTMAQN